MAFTYNTATNIGKIRLEIGDTDANTAGIKPDGSNFTDAELQVFLNREGSIMRAAAAALEVAARLYARAKNDPTSNRIATQARTLRRQHGHSAATTRTAGVIRVDAYSDSEPSDNL